MAWIEYVVIHIDGKKFELSKEAIKELYQELHGLLHDKPETPIQMCPSTKPSHSTLYETQLVALARE